MKKIILFVVCAFIAAGLFAQTSNAMNTVASPDNNVNFRLYQTRNMWTYLKLDTRSGVITQVQYDINGNNRMETMLNAFPLALSETQPGRFFLYPTENMFNFILLDQIDGRVWQVQWNIKEENRGVWRIN